MLSHGEETDNFTREVIPIARREFRESIGCCYSAKVGRA
jgi:hypothetical protein